MCSGPIAARASPPQGWRFRPPGLPRGRGVAGCPRTSTTRCGGSPLRCNDDWPRPVARARRSGRGFERRIPWVKNSMAASMSSTTMPTLSIRLTVMMSPWRLTSLALRREPRGRLLLNLGCLPRGSSPAAPGCAELMLAHPARDAQPSVARILPGATDECPTALAHEPASRIAHHDPLVSRRRCQPRQTTETTRFCTTVRVSGGRATG